MKLATIEKIKSVQNHSNADSLDIVQVLGYQVIVRRNQYKIGDLVVFISPDTVLPDAEWSKIYRAKSSRVKAIKLRGLFSMGIVESLSILGSVPQDLDPITDAHEGYEVSGMLGVTKYEPPLPQDAKAKGHLPFGISQTDEENYQRLLNIPFGAVVDVTLKIDGASTTVYHKAGDYGVTTRAMDLKPDCICNYTVAVSGFLDKFIFYCKEKGLNIALRGEIYGKGIQSFKGNPHALKPLSFALFEVLDLDTLQSQGTESELYFEKVGKALGIETVPILEKGVVLTPELIKKYDEDLTEINGQPFEGVVIKLPDGSSFKIINKSYDSKK